MTRQSSAPEQPVRRRKHLIDPTNPRPPQRYSTSLSTVQTWVLSTLAVATILHMSVGLVFAAAYVDDDRPDARIGLLPGARGRLLRALSVALGGPASGWARRCRRRLRSAVAFTT